MAIWALLQAIEILLLHEEEKKIKAKYLTKRLLK